jgi:hypothetical protein
MRASQFVLTAVLLATVSVLAAPGRAEEHRAYEAVVSLKGSTIGTVILLDIGDHGVSGWLRLEKTFVAIDSGSVTPDGVEFHSAGNTYRIDDRRNRIVYSGPQGEGDRLLEPLTRMSGRLQELVEETEDQPRSATLDVEARRRELSYGKPALWKRSGTPFVNFDRLDVLLGKQITVWVADADLRSGRIVAIEEPEGMDIPLKPPKPPKGQQKKEPPKQERKAK